MKSLERGQSFRNTWSALKISDVKPIGALRSRVANRQGLSDRFPRVEPLNCGRVGGKARPGPTPSSLIEPDVRISFIRLSRKGFHGSFKEPGTSERSSGKCCLREAEGA
jgi:hypothetical protein